MGVFASSETFKGKQCDLRDQTERPRQQGHVVKNSMDTRAR